MKRRFPILMLLAILVSAFAACNRNEETDEDDDIIESPEGYTMVWSDEFNEGSVNVENWNYETGDGTDYGLPVGWGNNELQLYTESPENSGIEMDGDVSALFIKATDDGGGNYTSAKLTTQNLMSMRFGRVDIRAKMPQGQGIWPAIWMLGDNIDQINWPGCGEIDIVEVLGHEPQKMYSTLHYTDSDKKHGETQGTYELSGESFSDDYHVYSLDWTPERLSFSVDGNTIEQMPIEDDMKEFLRSFYLILNVAVGGNWPGMPNNSTTFPQTMYVDYVRVYEKDGFEPPTPPALNIDEETMGQNIDPRLAAHAIKDDFTDLGDAEVIVYGGGGEPEISGSEKAIDGDSSLVFDYSGENWGGGYLELVSNVDLSSYSYLKFSLNKPAELSHVEVKLESLSTDAAVFLQDYSSSKVADGFVEYTIPLSDFEGLDLSEISIPFSLWNPQDGNENFVAGTVLIDNLYFSN